MGTISSQDKPKGNSYIAFYDLDRTITKAVSGSSLLRRAFRKGLLNRSYMLKAIYLSASYKLKMRDPVKIMNDMIHWVKGIREEDFSRLCSDTFQEILLPSIHSEVIAEIGMHKENNATTVILSSSLVQICREMADHLGMDDIVCSELEIADGYLTGFPKGRLCYGSEKVSGLTSYCEKNNSKIEDAWYYGDSISDLPVLNIVGNPVCVNPDSMLLKSARENDWKIFFWD